MTEQEGLFTVPTRLYLTARQRAKLHQLVREQDAELGDVITRIVAEQLDALPEAQQPTPAPQRAPSAELRNRRANLARLRAQRNAAGGAGPAWLNGYIAELEAEVRQLEAQ